MQVAQLASTRGQSHAIWAARAGKRPGHANKQESRRASRQESRRPACQQVGLTRVLALAAPRGGVFIVLIA